MVTLKPANLGGNNAKQKQYIVSHRKNTKNPGKTNLEPLSKLAFSAPSSRVPYRQLSIGCTSGCLFQPMSSNCSWFYPLVNRCQVSIKMATANTMSLAAGWPTSQNWTTSGPSGSLSAKLTIEMGNMMKYDDSPWHHDSPLTMMNHQIWGRFAKRNILELPSPASPNSIS
jgi:hypothetical protein